MKQYDVAIIGAGVVGASIARTLSRYALKIALLDVRGGRFHGRFARQFCHCARGIPL